MMMLVLLSGISVGMPLGAALLYLMACVVARRRARREFREKLKLVEEMGAAGFLYRPTPECDCFACNERRMARPEARA